MAFLKSRKGAAVVAVVVILFSVGFGSHRSLDAVRSDAWTVFESGILGNGSSVRRDLEARLAVGSNLYTVAGRYYDAGEPGMAALRVALDRLQADVTDPDAQAGLDNAVLQLLGLLDAESLSEQDAQYVSGFRSELQSRSLTIAKDPYTQMAQDFNDHVLGTFPASVLGPLTGVSPLPVYQ